MRFIQVTSRKDEKVIVNLGAVATIVNSLSHAEGSRMIFLDDSYIEVKETLSDIDKFLYNVGVI